jgi:hypothetical protein
VAERMSIKNSNDTIGNRSRELPVCSAVTEMSTSNNCWGVKGGRCVGLTTLSLHVPIILKSGSLNLLETYGPLQACNGIDLPLSLSIYLYMIRAWLEWNSIPIRSADIRLRSTTHTSHPTYTLLYPDDGLLASPKHVEV